MKKSKSAKEKRSLKAKSNSTFDVQSLSYVFFCILSVIVVLLAVVWAKKRMTLPPSTDTVPSDLMNAPVPKGANPEGKPRETDRECVDRHDTCKQFHAQGECHKNPGWMIMNCPKVCKSCHLRDPTLRCDRANLNMSLTPAYAPGDMDAMFEGLIEKYGDVYDINILSTSPWVVTFDNFLTEAETSALINTNNKWERSTDSGDTNDYGETGRVLSSGRTSSNSWCTRNCEEDPHVQNIARKIENITGVPQQNFESFQVLRYADGQKYNSHHDYGHEDVKLACGPRILTFFLYLSDVEDGGETAFSKLNIAVKPKRGKALLWPSTLNHDLEQQDPRTVHEAKPVTRGLKFAANSWVHLYEYKKPNLWGCTGAFDEL